jgi:hypothetical protein
MNKWRRSRNEQYYKTLIKQLIKSQFKRCKNLNIVGNTGEKKRQRRETKENWTYECRKMKIKKKFNDTEKEG